MAQNTTVSLTLQIKGNAGAELKKISDQQVQSTTKLNQQWTQVAGAQAKFVTTAKAGTQATVNTARAGDQLLRTNRMLEGVLRQQSIQTKLQSQMLKQQASSTQQIASWMRQVEQSSRRTQQSTKETSSNMSRLQKMGAIAGGVMMGGAVVSSALQKPRDYDKQLTYIAATATAGQGMSATDRLKSRGDLNKMVKDAVRSGGGSRDDAAEALNTLIASGKYEVNNVAPALKAAVKTAFSTDASANDAATLTTRMQDFGITNLQEGHDIAVRGGQLGSFEYKDQAKWLAQQMAAAKSIGYSGKQGFIQLVGMNQVAMTTAANSDEAGNNVVNLLAKLSSREFSKSIGDNVKIKAGDPTKMEGKKKPHAVFDWNTYAIQQRDQGVYGVDAFMKILERQFAGNKQYQALQDKAKNSSNSAERKQAIEDMINIAGGSEIGKIIADRQALMAAYAVSYQKDNLNKITGELQNSSGTVDADYKMVSQAEWAKDQSMNQEKLFAQSNAYDAVSGPLGGFKSVMTDLAAKHEGLATATYAATTALTALAAAGATAAVLNGGLGGSGGKGGLLKKAGGVATRGGAALATGATALAGSTLGQVAIAGGVGYGIGTVSRNMYMTTETGRKFDDKMGEAIAKTLAFFGNEDAKTAVEAQAKYDQMIAEQQAQTQQGERVIQALSDLKSTIANNRPVINFPSNSPFGQPLNREEKRHGAAAPWSLAAK